MNTPATPGSGTPLKALLVAPKFPYSFWSFSESCALTGVKTELPPLGLITVAALLPAAWSLRVVDLNVTDLCESDLEWADVVLLSSMINQLIPLRELLQKAKKLGKPTVVGGPITSSYPQKVIEAGCTYMVVGEAENIMDKVVAAIESGAPPTVIRAEERPDIETTVIPRYDLLDISAYGTLSLQTSRGCPHNCEFCDVITLLGRKQRFKTPEQVVRELDALRDLGWRGGVFIADDNFIGVKSRAKILLTRLIEWQKENDGMFGFFTQVTASLGSDLELIDMMTTANLGDVFVGIETPNEDALRKAGKHQNVTVPLAECLSAIMRNGITITGSFIIGLDGDGAGADDRMCNFVESLNIPLVMLNMIGVPPNTKLWKRLEQEGRLLPEAHADGMLHTNFVTSRPFEDIKVEYVSAWKRLYEPTTFIKRVYRHCLEMRPTRKASLKKGGAVDPSSIVPDPVKMNTPFRSQLVIFARICWRQGVVRSCRLRFWMQLLGIFWNNPSRFILYMTLCVQGEDMFKFCDYLEEHINLQKVDPQ